MPLLLLDSLMGISEPRTRNDVMERLLKLSDPIANIFKTRKPVRVKGSVYKPLTARERRKVDEYSTERRVV